MDATSGAPPRIARVEPLTLSRAVRGPFDYRLAPDQAGVEVGSVLRVRFGGRRTQAVVVEIASDSEIGPERLAEPEAVLEDKLPSDLVELATWMAVEYCSTLARALGLLLAPGTSSGVRSREVLTASLTDAGRVALRAGARLTERQRAALAQLDRDGPTATAKLGTATLRRLEHRHLVDMRAQVHRRRPLPLPVGRRPATPPPLTDHQREALEAVQDAMSRRAPEGFLLHGVTGSGKTEVYLHAVEAALAARRQAIVLVPEIALTPQVLGRFQARFGDVVAVLHSALRRGERHDEWLRLRSGEARVCVGPRSAVFAPLSDIGLIVIDEEHDASYKHEGDPRYDARTVAVRRARAHGAVVLAGSATPRPESVLQLSRLRLPSRIDAHTMPPVEILDMRGQHHPLHPRTRLALADVRRAGGKAIVLLNRRGWSNFLTCRSCGQVWMCPSCEVALVLHRAGGPALPARLSETGGRARQSEGGAGSPAGHFLACHHCGHTEGIPRRCHGCSSTALARHGSGTERLEHDLSEALGGDGEFPIFRLDADAAAGRDGAARTLRRFEEAAAGTLVGTQMVAKGHDFPDVTLAVVVDADQTLRFPDFRAEERTFALVAQLAGRAGRGRAGGKVLVQTLAPAASSILLAARHDADGFLAEELERRKGLGYPPFGSLIRVVCGAADARDALSLADELARRLGHAIGSVLGPAPLFRLRGRARAQLVVKSTDRSAAIRAVGAGVDELAAAAAKRGVSISVDVDPQ